MYSDLTGQIPRDRFHNVRLDGVFVFLYAFTMAGLCACNSGNELKKYNPGVIAKLDSFKAVEIADRYKNGKEEFNRYCAKCHIDPEIRMTDQYLLDNLFDKLPKPPIVYLTRFLKNSRNLKSSGDEYTRNLAIIWNSKYEHLFQDSLTNEELANLIGYIKLSIR